METVTGGTQNRQLTFGEKAVGLTFNPSNQPIVDAIKTKCAETIDLLNEARELSTNSEVKAQMTLAIRKIQEGQMWGVKGATWQY